MPIDSWKVPYFQNIQKLRKYASAWKNTRITRWIGKVVCMIRSLVFPRRFANPRSVVCSPIKFSTTEKVFALFVKQSRSNGKVVYNASKKLIDNNKSFLMKNFIQNNWRSTPEKSKSFWKGLIFILNVAYEYFLKSITYY